MLLQLLQLGCLSLHWSALYRQCFSFPLYIDQLSTRKRAKNSFASTWISGILITGIFFGLNFCLLWTFSIYFMSFLSLSVYIYIFSIALKHKRKIVSLQGSTQTSCVQLTRPWERKLTKTIVVSVYPICWVPSVALYSVLRPGDLLFRKIQPWINSVCYLSAVLNPFIYGVRIKNFRREVKRRIN